MQHLAVLKETLAEAEFGPRRTLLLSSSTSLQREGRIQGFTHFSTVLNYLTQITTVRNVCTGDAFSPCSVDRSHSLMPFDFRIDKTFLFANSSFANEDLESSLLSKLSCSCQCGHCLVITKTLTRRLKQVIPNLPAVKNDTL